jgi:hypothetical protein
MESMWRMALPLGLAVLTSNTLTAQLVTSLAPDTNATFERYIASAEPKITELARSNRPLPLLGEASVPKARSGEPVLRRVTDENGAAVPNGLIHDWVGGIFIPGATLDRVLSVLQDFDRHKQWYPEIVDSKLISKSGSEARGTWVMKKKKVITVVLRAELDSVYHAVNAGHAYVLSRSRPIIEVKEYGTPKQGEYPAGQGHGFLWRFNGYWTLHEADGGVYAECRIISLSRDVPSGLGWIVNPFVRSMPRESLETTLRKTKDAAGRATRPSSP